MLAIDLLGLAGLLMDGAAIVLLGLIVLLLAAATVHDLLRNPGRPR